MTEFERIPDYRGLALCWESIAVLAGRRSRFAECVQLIAAAGAVRTRLRVPKTESDSERIDSAVAAARVSLGDFALDREQQRGQTMSAAAVDELARAVIGAGTDEPRSGLGWEVLTAREQDVAALVAEGCTNQQIGNRLGIAARTAEAHVHNIMTKLDARSRAEIAVWAVTVPGGRPTGSERAPEQNA
jgi:DNA-binding NarL/FixJ family response regulator